MARLGPKAFEQCAGFLRIPGGDDPLDSSSVHPEAYPVVRRILASHRAGPALADRQQRRSCAGCGPTDFVDDTFGLPTVTDILAELEKPGRDPRPEFRTATFVEGVEKIGDLTPGMVLEGVVTNVAAFGAFVDVGVHQDGLVHVSAMSRTFVKDPREVVKSGDVVKVRVLDVDVPRKRISLTLRLDDEAGGGARAGRRPGPTPTGRTGANRAGPARARRRRAVQVRAAGPGRTGQAGQGRERSGTRRSRSSPDRARVVRDAAVRAKAVRDNRRHSGQGQAWARRSGTPGARQRWAARRQRDGRRPPAGRPALRPAARAARLPTVHGGPADRRGPGRRRRR